MWSYSWKSILSDRIVWDILKTALFPRTPFNVAISHYMFFTVKIDIFAENLTMNQLFQKHIKNASATFLVIVATCFLKNDDNIIFHHIYHSFHLVGEVWPDLWTPAPHSMLTENKRFYTYVLRNLRITASKNIEWGAGVHTSASPIINQAQAFFLKDEKAI